MRFQLTMILYYIILHIIYYIVIIEYIVLFSNTFYYV